MRDLRLRGIPYFSFTDTNMDLSDFCHIGSHFASDCLVVGEGTRDVGKPSK